MKPKYTETYIRQYQDYINWDDVSIYIDDFSKDFCREFDNKWNWNVIIEQKKKYNNVYQKLQKSNLIDENRIIVHCYNKNIFYVIAYNFFNNIIKGMQREYEKIQKGEQKPEERKLILDIWKEMDKNIIQAYFNNALQFTYEKENEYKKVHDNFCDILKKILLNKMISKNYLPGINYDKSSETLANVDFLTEEERFIQLKKGCRYFYMARDFNCIYFNRQIFREICEQINNISKEKYQINAQ